MALQANKASNGRENKMGLKGLVPDMSPSEETTTIESVHKSKLIFDGVSEETTIIDVNDSVTKSKSGKVAGACYSGAFWKFCSLKQAYATLKAGMEVLQICKDVVSDANISVTTIQERLASDLEQADSALQTAMECVQIFTEVVSVDNTADTTTLNHWASAYEKVDAALQAVMKCIQICKDVVSGAEILVTKIGKFWASTLDQAEAALQAAMEGLQMCKGVVSVAESVVTNTEEQVDWTCAIEQIGCALKAGRECLQMCKGVFSEADAFVTTAETKDSITVSDKRKKMKKKASDMRKRKNKVGILRSEDSQ